MTEEQKQLIVEILQKLANKSLSFAWNHSGSISDDCKRIRTEIKEYAQKLEVDEPCVEWEIYILDESN